MREIVYAMHFRGQASRSSGDQKEVKIASSGTSCTMNTVVGPDGIETSLAPAPGELAFLDCELQFTGQASFTGNGTLTFGDDGEAALRFQTLEPGHLGPSLAPGVLAGAVSWRIEGGSGRFAAATGFLSAVFTMKESGELSEYQCGTIFLPE